MISPLGWAVIIYIAVSYVFVAFLAVAWKQYKEDKQR